MDLTLEPVRVATGEEGDGRLVYRDGSLVAVLVQLSELHADEAGAWFLEKGFGVLDAPEAPTFETLESAEMWIREQLQRKKTDGINT